MDNHRPLAALLALLILAALMAGAGTLIQNSQLAEMSASTIKGRISSTGSPQDLSAASQVAPLLPLDQLKEPNDTARLDVQWNRHGLVPRPTPSRVFGTDPNGIPVWATPGAGGGGGTIDGSGAATQITVWSDPNTIMGDPGLLYTDCGVCGGSPDPDRYTVQTWVGDSTGSAGLWLRGAQDFEGSDVGGIRIYNDPNDGSSEKVAGIEATRGSGAAVGNLALGTSSGASSYTTRISIQGAGSTAITGLVEATAAHTSTAGTLTLHASTSGAGASLCLDANDPNGTDVKWSALASQSGPFVIRRACGSGAGDGSDDRWRLGTGGEMQIPQISTPSDPGSGWTAVYSKSDGKIYRRPAGGSEAEVGGSGGLSSVTESDLSLSDVTTANASTTKHGFLKKLPNDATVFMNGQGDWVTSTIYPTYYGTGADGAVTISADTTWETSTAANDTGIIEKNFTSLTIDAGKTVTPAHRPRVMIVYVSGNCTINGTLSVSSAAAVRTTDLIVSRRLAGTPSDADLPHETMLTPYGSYAMVLAYATGASGGATQATGTVSAGNAGANAYQGQTGGGGSGAGGQGGGASVGNGGAGAAGSAFGGGSGGGAGGFAGGTGTAGTAGGASQGSGGNAGTYTADANGANGGGAGNPVGSSNARGTGTSSAPPGGGGGVLLLVVGGNLTIGSAGVISADGSRGANVTAGAGSRAMGGGGAGGGRILALVAGTTTGIASTTTSQITFTGGGVMRALGGAGGTASGGSLSNSAGGAGGNGSVQLLAITP